MLRQLLLMTMHNREAIVSTVGCVIVPCAADKVKGYCKNKRRNTSVANKLRFNCRSNLKLIKILLKESIR